STAFTLYFPSPCGKVNEVEVVESILLEPLYIRYPTTFPLEAPQDIFSPLALISPGFAGGLPSSLIELEATFLLPDTDIFSQASRFVRGNKTDKSPNLS